MKQDLIKKFSRSISTDIELSKYSWFNLGGPAELFFKPENKNQLIEFLKHIKENKLKITVIGAGSNTLIRDDGIKGVVIKLGPNFSEIKLINENTIQVGAAMLDRKISNFAKENGIGGLEFLSCIPGSIGGAVIMNSGCYGCEISKVLSSITVIDVQDCIEKQIAREDIDFFYRGTNLPSNLIITEVKLKGTVADKQLIEKKTITNVRTKKIIST